MPAALHFSLQGIRSVVIFLPLQLYLRAALSSGSQLSYAVFVVPYHVLYETEPCSFSLFSGFVSVQAFCCVLETTSPTIFEPMFQTMTPATMMASAARRNSFMTIGRCGGI